MFPFLWFRGQVEGPHQGHNHLVWPTHNLHHLLPIIPPPLLQRLPPTSFSCPSLLQSLHKSILPLAHLNFLPRDPFLFHPFRKRGKSRIEPTSAALANPLATESQSATCEAVRSKPGNIAMTLTKQRSRSNRDRDPEKFPTTQLFLLGTSYPPGDVIPDGRHRKAYAMLYNS